MDQDNELLEERKRRMSETYYKERARLEAMSLLELLRARHINRWGWIRWWFRHRVIGVGQ